MVIQVSNYSIIQTAEREKWYELLPSGSVTSQFLYKTFTWCPIVIASKVQIWSYKKKRLTVPNIVKYYYAAMLVVAN